MIAAGRFAELAEHCAIPAMNRNRAGHAAVRQMLYQPEEERQVPGIDPLLVEREDVGAALGQQQIVGVLDPLGDALAGERRADVVLRDERGKLVVGDFGVDGHRAPSRREEESRRILAKLGGGGEMPRRSL